MNAKKCKAIRRLLRAKGVNPREDHYIQNPTTLRTKSFETGALDSQGKPVLGHYQTVTWVLAPGAGRRAYKGMKAVVAARAA